MKAILGKTCLAVLASAAIGVSASAQAAEDCPLPGNLRLPYGSLSFVLMGGTPGYMAPEVLKCQPYGLAADVWSLGITLHAMAFGNVPYTGTLPEIMENVAKTEEWTISDDGHDDKNMVALLRGLITKSPKERMTLADVQKHPTDTAQARRGATPAGRAGTWQRTW